MKTDHIIFATASNREKMEQALRKFYCSDKATFSAHGIVNNGTRDLDRVEVVPHRGGFKFQSK